MNENSGLIKVGVIGTHGTGKSTLCHELIYGLSVLNIPAEYIGETAREVPAGLVINEGTDIKTQDWILHTQIAKELVIKKGIVICDRGSIDNYAYRRRLSSSSVYDELVREHAGTYSLLLKVPINPNYLTEDGVRSVNKPFQLEIEGILEEMLMDWKIPFKNYTTTEEAIKEIITLIGK